jgi:hypothetical protein
MKQRRINMKWTDLIIPGLLTYAVLKYARETNTQFASQPNLSNLNNNVPLRYPLVNPPKAVVATALSNAEIDEIIHKTCDDYAKKSLSLTPPTPPLPTMSLVPDKTTTEANKWLEIVKHPSEVVILGKRGSGKSCLAYRIAEHLRFIAPIYVVALPDASKKCLPDWAGIVSTIGNLPNDSIAIVDEAHIRYNARSSMTSEAKEMSKSINLSRQKNQTIIFVSQESNQIDRNILGGAGVIIFKEPSLLQTIIDRPQLRKIAERASQSFQNVTGDRRKWSYVFSEAKGDVGLVESAIPTFWTDKLSRAFSIEGESTAVRAKVTTLDERIIKAKELHGQHLSLSQIGQRLGVSKSTVKNYIDGYPYEKRI